VPYPAVRARPSQQIQRHAPKQSDRVHTRLDCACPHTGDFEELRNFGMCETRSGWFCLRGVKPRSPRERKPCIQHRQCGHGAKPQGRLLDGRSTRKVHRPGGGLESNPRQLLRPHRERRLATGRAKCAALVGDNQRTPRTDRAQIARPAPISGDERHQPPQARPRRRLPLNHWRSKKAP
jgi:hypothetical protein